MANNPYATGKALRQALETRLNAKVTTNAEIQRLRRLVSFDRLLARLFADQSSPWLVKGGYSLEVRYGMKARTTRDVDLTDGKSKNIETPPPPFCPSLPEREENIGEQCRLMHF